MRIKDTNTGTRVISGQAISGRKTRDLLPSEGSKVLMPGTVSATSGFLFLEGF